MAAKLYISTDLVMIQSVIVQKKYNFPENGRTM